MADLDLRSARAKLRRADHHIKELVTEIESFRNSDAYSVAIDTQHSPGQDFMRMRVRVREPPPVDDWGAIVGDVVHCLRASLDNLVCALVVARDPNSECRGTEFPIFKDKEAAPGIRGYWAQPGKPEATGNGHRKLLGVPEEYRTVIDKLQPFERRKTEPDRDPLWILHQLDIGDKHRAIAILGLFVKVEISPGEIQTGSMPPETDLEIIDLGEFRPFQDGAEVARFRLLNVPGTFGSAIETYVNRTIAFDIAFDQGSPAFGERVFTTLKDIRRDVASVIGSIASVARSIE